MMTDNNTYTDQQYYAAWLENCDGDNIVVINCSDYVIEAPYGKRVYRCDMSKVNEETARFLLYHGVTRKLQNAGIGGPDKAAAMIKRIENNLAATDDRALVDAIINVAATMFPKKFADCKGKRDCREVWWKFPAKVKSAVNNQYNAMMAINVDFEDDDS